MFGKLRALLMAPFKLLGGISKGSGAVGKFATLGSTILLPFFLTAAGIKAAAASGKMVIGKAREVATNGNIFGSFWSSLGTNPLTGEFGIMPGLTNMKNGALHYGKSGYNFANAGFNAYRKDKSMFDALKKTWNAPVEKLEVASNLPSDVEFIPLSETPVIEEVAEASASVITDEFTKEAANEATGNILLTGLTSAADTAFMPGSGLAARGGIKAATFIVNVFVAEPDPLLELVA